MGSKRFQTPQRDNPKPAPAKKSASETTSHLVASRPPQGLNKFRAASSNDLTLTHHNLLSLQRTIGNRAVNRFIQAKLKVSQPGDEGEREADQVAEQVMRKPSPATVSGSASTPKISSAPIQRQPLSEEEPPEEEGVVQTKQASASVLSEDQTKKPDEEERKKHKEDDKTIQAKGQAGEAPSVSANVESQIKGMQGSGDPLPDNMRTHFESQFGQDFSEVRVHKGAQAGETAKAINAKAYTIGKDIVFGAGAYAPEMAEGQKLLAHELTHVVQQGSVGQSVQRYEAGEHAELGETQAELKAAFAPQGYTVLKGERLSTIAKKFRITVAELKQANKAKLKKWPASDGSGRMIEGFNAGEKISIPQKLNEFAQGAIKDKSATFTVNGVVLEYGVGIAMGDLFESPEQMAKASPKDIKELAALIKREQAGGKVTTEEWEKATGGKYLKLAEENKAHFAPPSARLVKPTAAGAASPNHKSEWEKHHAAALEASIAGDKNKALMLNAFADHFLTDAFAAGHLINKSDVMEQFKSQLKLDAKGEDFVKESQKFFDDVAADAFTGGVKTEFSKYETVKTYYGVHADIDRVSRFSTLLQEIHKEKPDLVANAVAKGVHDKLNTFPGGIPVENAKGSPPWKLSGDGTLNKETISVARQAVAQSQLNVLSVYKLVGPPNIPALFKKVWDYTPRPTSAGFKQVSGEVTKGTDIKSADLKKSVVTLIQANYKLIIDKLVGLKKLQKI